MGCSWFVSLALHKTVPASQAASSRRFRKSAGSGRSSSCFGRWISRPVEVEQHPLRWRACTVFESIVPHFDLVALGHEEEASLRFKESTRGGV